jgi:hypothetical protein
LRVRQDLEKLVSSDEIGRRAAGHLQIRTRTFRSPCGGRRSPGHRWRAAASASVRGQCQFRRGAARARLGYRRDQSRVTDSSADRLLDRDRSFRRVRRAVTAKPPLRKPGRESAGLYCSRDGAADPAGYRPRKLSLRERRPFRLLRMQTRAVLRGRCRTGRPSTLSAIAEDAVCVRRQFLVPGDRVGRSAPPRHGPR